MYTKQRSRLTFHSEKFMFIYVATVVKQFQELSLIMCQSALVAIQSTECRLLAPDLRIKNQYVLFVMAFNYLNGFVPIYYFFLFSCQGYVN